MSNLNEPASDNVVIAVLGVNDRDGFLEASEAGYTARSTDYRNVTFEILSIAEDREYAHALVQFEGERQNGLKEARHIFYVGQFIDDLISQLYL